MMVVYLCNFVLKWLLISSGVGDNQSSPVILRF